MRILFVASGVPSKIHQIHVYNLVKVLRGKHRVDVVCFDLGERTAATSPEGLPPNGEFVRVPLRRRSLLMRGLRCAVTGEPVAVQAYRSAAMVEAIAAIRDRGGHDLVVVEHHALAQYRPVLGSGPKLLFPVDAVSRLKRQFYLAEPNPVLRVVRRVDYSLTKRYERLTYRAFDGVVFVSDVDAEYSISGGLGERALLHVLPNGVDTEYFCPCKVDGAGTTLAFVGNMENPTNEHAMLWFFRHVWDRLAASIPGVKLAIVGRNPTERVQALRRVDGSVIVTGYVDDFRPYVWNATVFISPLQLGTGIKNRMLQAMAMGRAIVASPLSIEGIEAQDGVHYLLARSADDFVDRIRRLLDDGSARDRLAQQARTLVEERYGLEAAGHRFLTIADAVLARRGTGHAAARPVGAQPEVG